MPQKRIKEASQNIVTYRVRLLYDDDTKGEIQAKKMVNTDHLVGLTLKQAKMKLGVHK